MSGAALNTSGCVPHVTRLDGTRAHALYWHHLDAFTQGYVEALARSPLTLDDGLAAVFPDARPQFLTHFSDLAPESLAAILTDCARYRGRTASKCARIGGLFWKNRAAGYLAGDGFPPVTATLGDDGTVYLGERA